MLFSKTNKKKKQAKKIANVHKDVEELEPLSIAGKNIKWCSCCRKQYGGFSKNKKK